MNKVTVSGPVAWVHGDEKHREARKKSGYNDLTLMMFVKDQAGQTVLSLPFFPGC